jgi:hypothetical protein
MSVWYETKEDLGEEPAVERGYHHVAKTSDEAVDDAEAPRGKNDECRAQLEQLYAVVSHAYILDALLRTDRHFDQGPGLAFGWIMRTLSVFRNPISIERECD